MIQITVPITSRLHAHNSGNWEAKQSAVKQAREMATLLAMHQEPIAGVAVVSILFRVPDRRRRDRLNLAHSCKPYIDGVCDAKKITGDHWEALEVGRIEVEVVKGLKSVEAVLTFMGIEYCPEFYKHNTGSSR